MIKFIQVMRNMHQFITCSQFAHLEHFSFALKYGDILHLVFPGTNVLSGGVLLKWMDTIACLSAELLAHGPCVTASVDDMQLKAFPTIGTLSLLLLFIT